MIVLENYNENMDLKEKNETHNYMASSKSPKGKELNPVTTAAFDFTSNKPEDVDMEHKRNEKNPFKNDEKTIITKQENLINLTNNTAGAETACDLVLSSPGLK